MSTTHSDDEIFQIRKPKKFIWRPKEDITTYELALTMPIWTRSTVAGFSIQDVEEVIESLPENVKRHFEEI